MRISPTLLLAMKGYLSSYPFEEPDLQQEVMDALNNAKPTEFKIDADNDIIEVLQDLANELRD